jgi:X-Pro dipeptidyl-peptidase
MTSRRCAAIAIATLLALPSAAAAAQRPTPPPWLKIENGVTQPQFDFAQAIEETVFVESELDSDRDGRKDRIRIRISRPGGEAAQGIKVPVIFEHSPYRSPTPGPIVNHNVDFDVLPQERIGKSKSARAAAKRQRARADLPGSLDNYYVPRGYAVVLGESIGTYNSEGCPDVGARNETLGTKAVIDWLNGRARGENEAGERVEADWTTGAVGMVGTSYNGTLPNQVATTGVEGLETIVPVSAISSWYDYYRANGLVVAPHSQRHGAGDNDFLGEDTDVLASFIDGDPASEPICDWLLPFLNRAQDRETGDWSPFWQARDYLSRARDVKASVFVVHGLNDFNVRTKAFAAWWERLRVARKIWLHNRGHENPGGTGTPYKLTENRWFDHWLFGVENGIMDEPRATVQREDGTFVPEADWPAPGARHTTFRLSAPSAGAPGDLTPSKAGHSPDQRFIDRGRELDTDEVLIQNPDAAHPNRLIYRTQPLPAAARLSGTPFVELRMSIDNRNAANLTAVLVDYAPDGTAAMVTRGWLDPQNRKSLTRSSPIKRGHEYRFRWDLQPDDHIFQAGHRIGLVVVSTDHDYTIRPLPGTRLTLDPDGSSLTLPLAG